MPLVTGGSTVEIVINARDNASENIQDVEKNLSKMENKLDDSTEKMVRSSAASDMFVVALGNLAAIVGEQITKVLGQAVEAFQEYGNAVYDLTQEFNLSAESASRLFQVTEQLGKSPKELTKILEELKKKGIDPLGDGFDDLAEGLGLSENALRSMYDAVSENAILTDDMVRVAREQKLAVDLMNNAWQNFARTIGAEASPAITKFLTALTHNNEIIEERSRLMKEGLSYDEANTKAIENVIEAVGKENAVLYENTDALDERALALDEQTAATEAAKKSQENFANEMNYLKSI
ncbi:MAG TPA: hypothetical protein VMW84_03065, partial [Acidobacteriota bacterium]|nr:hypothetical protein [Acidobacteriota bacterium]